MAVWHPGHSVEVLENGDDFFPQALEAIGKAQKEVLLETFIFCNDDIGQAFRDALIAAAERGAWVSALVDGWGSYYLPRDMVDEMRRAGVHFHFYEPGPKWLRSRLNILRRMHRKLIVVDGETAFIGGINLAHNHQSDFGPEFKQDYAARVRGPVVTEIRNFTRNAFAACAGKDVSDPGSPMVDPVSDGAVPPAGEAQALFLTRDNDHNLTSIENHYIERIQQAERRVSIANAYFFPGYRLLRALRDAARRGVQVQLLIQGLPGSPLAKHAAATLYDFLVESDIEVYEYWEHQLHGKIAAIDDDWATIGSSNLDPFSLCFNLEANLFVRDKEVNRSVHAHVQQLIEHSDVRRIDQSWLRRRTLIKWLRSVLLYHFLRYFPGAAGWLPRLHPKAHINELRDQIQARDSHNR